MEFIIIWDIDLVVVEEQSIFEFPFSTFDDFLSMCFEVSEDLGEVVIV